MPADEVPRAKSTRSRKFRVAAVRDRGSPGLLRWLAMTLSIPLPWIGAGLALLGVSQLTRGDYGGGWLVALGLLAIVIDVVGDLWLHRDMVEQSDRHHLNARAERLVGQTALLGKPIAAGRGRVDLGGTLWAVEGPDLPTGARVRVIACRGAILVVAPVAPE